MRPKKLADFFGSGAVYPMCSMPDTRSGSCEPPVCANAAGLSNVVAIISLLVNFIGLASLIHASLPHHLQLWGPPIDPPGCSLSFSLYPTGTESRDKVMSTTKVSPPAPTEYPKYTRE